MKLNAVFRDSQAIHSQNFIETRPLLLALCALQFCIHVRIQRNQIMQTPQLSTHKISSKSVHNLLRYPAKIQKSDVNPVPGSGL